MNCYFVRMVYGKSCTKFPYFVVIVQLMAFFLQKRVVLFWCVKFWPFSFLVCLILATFGSHVFNFFCQLIQNVNESVLISTSDTTFLLLLTGYFDVLKTKSIMDKL